MTSMTRLRSTLAIVMIAAVSMAATVPRTASPQSPDPAASPAVHVDSVELNLSVQPRFTFAVSIPTVLRFEAVNYNGLQLLHIWAYSRTDSVDARIHRISAYLSPKAGLLTPLFETPSGTPIMGYVDRAEFEKAVQRALRDASSERRLSYNRRLS